MKRSSTNPSGGKFVGCSRRFLSHVTYYQQTGGLHEQVATAPLGGVTIHGRSQRVARSQDRRRGVHRPDGHSDCHVVFPVLGLFAGRRQADIGQRRTRQEKPRREPGPHTSTKKSEARSAPRPRSMTRPRKKSPPTSRRSTSGSTAMINAVNTAVSKAQAKGPGDRARRDQAERSADRRLVPQRAQQDLYLVARPDRRADGEPGAA